MADINVDVDGANEVAGAIKSGITDGLHEAGEWMLDEGESKAREGVLSAERVWRNTLEEGFSSSSAGELKLRWYRWAGTIENSAPHAKVNEKGLNPGNSPSVQDIMPWVDDNLQPNASAQARAESAHIGNWDPSLQALAVQYGKAKVMTAFAVKGKLENRGYRGIHFMDAAEAYLRKVGPLIVKTKVEAEIRKKLRSTRN